MLVSFTVATHRSEYNTNFVDGNCSVQRVEVVNELRIEVSAIMVIINAFIKVRKQDQLDKN